MVLYCTLPEGAVRLLRLLPHPDKHSDIKCQLFTCTMLNSASTHPYDALSYSWGSESNQQFIYIDNYKLSVRANLYAALLNLRDGFMDRIFWIDAICINQASNNEKTVHILYMEEI